MTTANAPHATTAQRRRWLTIALYGAAVLAGFALRYWLWRDQGRAGIVPVGDADEYYLGAIHMWRDGSYYDEGQWLRPPLTSVLYAGIFALVGPNIPLALLIQAALSAFTALLIGRTARSVWDSARAGIAATWATALYLPYAVAASLMLSETLCIAALVLAFWLFEKARRGNLRRIWPLVLGGSAFGAAALVRPVGVYAIPLLGLWPVLEFRQLRPALRPALAIVLAAICTILPWSVRNTLVYHQPVLVDTNGGVSFWFGTISDPADQKMQDVWKATLPNSALRQQAALRLGLANIAADPGRYIRGMRSKAVALWQPETRLFPSNAVRGVTIAQHSLGFNLLADAEYLGLMVLAIVGVAVTRRSERNWALLGWPLYGTFLTSLTLGHARLRLPLLMTALVYAALPLAHPRTTLQRIGQLRRRAQVGLALALLVWLAMVSSTAYIPFLAGQLAAWRGDRAGLAAAQHRDPRGFLPALELGRSLRAAGDTAGATAAFADAAAKNPSSVEAHVALLRAAIDRGDTAGAETERKALDQLGWDQNQTYRWAWSHEAYAAPGGLNLGTAADIGAISGFSTIQEHDGSRARATVLPAAQIRLARRGAQQLVVRVRAAAGTTPLRLLVNESERLQTTVDQSWQEIAVPLLPDAGDTLVVELQAPVTVPSIEQPYPEGVIVDWVQLR